MDNYKIKIIVKVNNTMNLQNNEGVSVSKRLFGKMCFLVFVISVSLYLLFAFALSPLIAYVNSDKTLTFPFFPTFSISRLAH